MDDHAESTTAAHDTGRPDESDQPRTMVEQIIFAVSEQEAPAASAARVGPGFAEEALQGPRQRLDELVRDGALAALLDPAVVVGAEPGQDRELLLAQAGDAP